MIKVMTVHYQTLPTLTATKNVPLIWKAKPAILTSYIKMDSNLENILDDNDSEFEESAEELVDGINILIISRKHVLIVFLIQSHRLIFSAFSDKLLPF
jgi:hypothetical protein